MDGDPGSVRNGIIEKLSNKASLNQQVFDNTFSVFGNLKEILHEMSSEIDDTLEEAGKEARIEYRDRGKFEAQLQIADDILIFSMHSNIFEFNREHIIWQNSYVQQARENSYCGMINIYNFLSDSFKFNRNADEGYLDDVKLGSAEASHIFGTGGTGCPIGGGPDHVGIGDNDLAGGGFLGSCRSDEASCGNGS